MLLRRFNRLQLGVRYRLRATSASGSRRCAELWLLSVSQHHLLSLFEKHLFLRLLIQLQQSFLEAIINRRDLRVVRIQQFLRHSQLTINVLFQTTGLLRAAHGLHHCDLVVLEDLLLDLASLLRRHLLKRLDR